MPTLVLPNRVIRILPLSMFSIVVRTAMGTLQPPSSVLSIPRSAAHAILVGACSKTLVNWIVLSSLRERAAVHTHILS